jgi:hypothetical protein
VAVVVYESIDQKPTESGIHENIHLAVFGVTPEPGLVTESGMVRSRGARRVVFRIWCAAWMANAEKRIPELLFGG